MEDMQLCACGCNQEITRKPRPDRLNLYIHGHHRKGKPLSEEHKERIGLANSGRKMSKRQRKLLSQIHKENYAIGKQIHWSYTSKRDEIINKIKQNRVYTPEPRTNIKGKYITKNGYVMIWFRNHFGKRYGYMLEHRYTMENHLNRILESIEDVHHIDGDKTNNTLDNLMLFPTRSAHIKFHNSHK